MKKSHLKKSQKRSALDLLKKSRIRKDYKMINRMLERLKQERG